ncbi:uncharacterized protein LOC133926846 [Phragmites australis]|uniref:uncharacterized protein LOC133926846 n=1 Tax=Phragmites australis TaxID=29695 RepID=UPI002D7680B1|nr:uncharacterized protein LOC133926846 [Phragmites australis]
MPDSADPLPSQPPPGPSAAARPDPDMPPRKPSAGGKLKKPLTDKQRAAAEQRLAHLRSNLLLRSLDSPALTLPPPYEAALFALGLLDFARLDLASDAPRPDLVAPLVAYYDPACKRSFVRGIRVSVSRHDLSRALSLPPKPAAAAEAPPDVDPAAVAPAVMQLLQEYVLLPFQGDDMCILPQEVAAAEQAVREGLAHRVDWAGLIWGLVEKEMLELPKREDGVCYYGPHLQRLIWAQKPKLFEPVEEGDRVELVPEASVDVEIDEEDEDADADVKNKSLEDTDADVKNESLEELELADRDAGVRSKSLEELELANGDVGVSSKSLEDSELGNADASSKDLDELELGDADTTNTILEELGLRDEDVRSKSMDELEAVDEDARSKRLDESEAADEDSRRKSLDELEAVHEGAKGTSFDESGMVDEHPKGMNLDGLGLGFVTIEAVPAAHEAMCTDNENATEAVPEGGDDVAVDAEEEGEGSLVETVVLVTKEEVMAVPEEVGDEEAEGEEKDATGLSLGINSTNVYDSMDVEEDMNVENLDEGDSGNEEAEELEDDAFEECNGGEEMNWRIGDGKGDEGMTHCLQRCNTFGGMEFENLNKGEAEMRDEFDDFSGRGSLDRMTSSNLLQAMNSIPSSYNVTENVHDLSSGEFLAMGADAHKNGVDLGPGSSYLFGNNGKRHIGDTDGYDGNMHVQEQFPQCNQQKRMRQSNSSNISPGSAVFNANFLIPIQNLVVEASRLYGQKEQELQSLQFEKQQWANMLQQKEAIIQSLNSSRFEQQNKHQAELRRFEHDLNVMAQLVTGYKKALKQTRASFDVYRKKFPCNKPRYADVPGGGGLVLSVKELERKRLEEEQQKLAAANEMIRKFQYEWFLKLDEWMLCVDSLGRKMEELSKEINPLKEIIKARFATPATEE